MFRKDIEAIIYKLQVRIDELERLVGPLYVEDFFKNCPCCGNRKLILKSEAIKFEKLNYWHSDTFLTLHYTTKKGYANHLPAIKEWVKEVENYKKLPK